MMLVDNWQAVIKSAWSFWLPLIGLALNYAPQIVPYVPDGLLPWWVGPAIIVAGPVLRLFKQKSVSGEPTADDSAED